MKQLKASEVLEGLQDAALQDLEGTSDEQLLKECVEDGDDPADVAATLRSQLALKLAARRRRQLTESRERLAHSRPHSLLERPAIERIKALVQSAFQSNCSLQIAFRDGKRQTDADWESLYDDLIRLGAIKHAGRDV